MGTTLRVPGSRPILIGVLGLVLLSSCYTAKPLSVHPEPRYADATRISRPDGTIESLRPLLITDRSEYYSLTYWSSGLRIDGYFGRPRVRSERLPALIWNRGGNRAYGPLDPRSLVPYVEAGFVVVGSQYRGGPGSEGVDRFGGDDLEDVMNLVALIKALPEVDPGRIGMVGYSRGGMMTYLALREDARRGRNSIKVAATVGGLADLFDLEHRPDMLSVYQSTLGCEPDECPADYQARSAVRWGAEIRAPLLILHGESDDRVDVSQSVRLAEALRAAGREVQLITFPGDDHVLSHHDYGVPDILQWLGAHLRNPQDHIARERVLARAMEVYRIWPSE